MSVTQLTAAGFNFKEGKVIYLATASVSFVVTNHK